MKKPTATKKPARKSAPKARSIDQQIHVHPHLIEYHDADSLAGAALPRYAITSPRNDAASLRILAGGLSIAAGGIPIKMFDAAGNPTA